MLTEASPDHGTASGAPPEVAPARSAWWVRLPAHIPLRVLYGFASVLGWLAYRVFPYRERLVRESAQHMVRIKLGKFEGIYREYA